jgi:FKBP12-rapamycin complex-associated protein
MDEMKIQHSKYESYISKLKNPSSVDTQTESIVNVNSVVSTGQITRSDNRYVYMIRTERIRSHWLQATQQNANDLPMWLNKFQQLLLEQSPVYLLKAVGSRLSQASPSIPRDLFNASFVACWNELKPDDRLSLTNALTHVLTVCDKPDVIQTILNLSEFENHCDLQLNDNHERSLIDIHLLSEKAFSVRAYAKALRYKEEEFQSEPITSDTIESLISINYELQQPEAAYGALQYAKHHNIKIKGLWYEKLNQWERALRNYEFLKTNDALNMDIHLGRMRCMQALGSWADLKDLACQVWDLTDQIRDEQPITMLPFTTSLTEKNSSAPSLNPSQGIINGRELKKILQQKIAPMATRAAWSLGDLTDMEKYYIHIPDTKFEGAYYRAVDAIRNDNYRQAQDSIDLARELLYVELTTLANESYNRAYSGN